MPHLPTPPPLAKTDWASKAPINWYIHDQLNGLLYLEWHMTADGHNGEKYSSVLGIGAALHSTGQTTYEFVLNWNNGRGTPQVEVIGECYSDDHLFNVLNGMKLDLLGNCSVKVTPKDNTAD